MKKLLILFLLLTLLLASCTVSDGGETSASPDTTAPEVTTGGGTDPSPWHLSAPCEWEIRYYKTPAEKEELRFQVPLVHEGEVGGFMLKCEFFQEYYSISEPIQVRLSITNNTGEDIEYASNPGYLGSVTGDGTSLGNFYSIKAADLTDVDTPIFRTLPSGETVVYESIFVGDPALIETQRTYEYSLTLYIKGAEDFKVFSVPIAIVSRAS